jgi:hypothetical protein
LALIRVAIDRGLDTTLTSGVANAFDVVLDLEVVAVTPNLDPTVANAMEMASQQAGAQRAVWVDTGELDPTSFDRMVTGVDTACETAGVDMT